MARRRIIPIREKKTDFLGFKMTKSERKILADIAKENNCTATAVLRYGWDIVLNRYKKAKGGEEETED